MSAPELVFHVGMPKTGTTSIQHFFRQHYKSALKQGLLYPKAGSSNNGLAHHPWHKTFSDEPRPVVEDWIPEGDKSEMLRDLAAEVRRQRPRKLLLSSESFRPSSVSRLLAELPHCKAVVVLFLRRADHLLEAQYAQGIKTGRHKMSPSEFFDYICQLQPDWLRPYQRLSEYAALDCEFIIQPFEKEQLGDGLIHKFLEIIGQTNLDQLVEGTSRNERLHPLVTQLLASRSTDQRLLGASYNAMRNKLNDLSWNMASPESTSFFSPQQKCAILECAREDYSLIEQELLRPSQRLFHEVEPDASTHWQPPDELSHENSADLMVALWDWFWEQKS